MILQQRYHRRFTRYLDLANDVSDEDTPPSNPGTSSSDSGISKSPGLPTINEGCCEESPIVDIEDLNDSMCPSRFGCQGQKRQECHGIVRQYEEQIDNDLEYIEEDPESHEPQFLRHTVLLILLLCSMFVVSVRETEK